MDSPRDDTSDELYLTRGAFTIAAVRADTETNGMEAGFATVHNVRASGRSATGRR